MAIVIKPADSSSSPIGLGDCLEMIGKSLDPRDEDSVIEQAPVLKLLADNKLFLVNFLNRELTKFLADNRFSLYSPQSFILGGNATTWTIRGNFWFPLAKAGSLASVQSSVFSYQLPHNHNFSLLTVGWFGPGYETDLWECDPHSIRGIPRERVELRFLGRESLPRGKILFYRPFKDVHIQYSLPRLSISLNLLAIPESFRSKEQYIFDVSTSQIVGVPDDLAGSRRGSILELCGYFGNAETHALLYDVAVSHPCRRTRAGAMRGLAVAGTESAHRAALENARSGDAFLRMHCEKVLDRLQEGQKEI